MTMKGRSGELYGDRPLLEGTAGDLYVVRCGPVRRKRAPKRLMELVGVIDVFSMTAEDLDDLVIPDVIEIRGHSPILAEELYLPSSNLGPAGVNTHHRRHLDPLSAIPLGPAPPMRTMGTWAC